MRVMASINDTKWLFCCQDSQHSENNKKNYWPALAPTLVRGFFPSRHNDSEEVAFKHLYFRIAIKLHIFCQMPPACSHGAVVNNASQCKHFFRFKAEVWNNFGYWTHYEQVITSNDNTSNVVTSNDNTSNVVTSNDITSNGHTKMGILQFFPLVLIAYFPRHNKRCYESEMNSHFHSIFCLTSEKR